MSRPPHPTISPHALCQHFGCPIAHGSTLRPIAEHYSGRQNVTSTNRVNLGARTPSD